MLPYLYLADTRCPMSRIVSPLTTPLVGLFVSNRPCDTHLAADIEVTLGAVLLHQPNDVIQRVWLCKKRDLIGNSEGVIFPLATITWIGGHHPG
jgi:hypothetical protein